MLPVFCVLLFFVRKCIAFVVFRISFCEMRTDVCEFPVLEYQKVMAFGEFLELVDEITVKVIDYVYMRL